MSSPDPVNGRDVTEHRRTADVTASDRRPGLPRARDRVGRSRLAIDDFGRGSSTLAYLNHLPAAILKIDRVFTAGLDRPDAADGHVNRGRIGSADPITLFRSIVAMAHSLGLDVVAEGVETEGQLAIVRSTGCAYAQGFLLGRPVPIVEFDTMLFEQFADHAR